MKLSELDFEVKLWSLQFDGYYGTQLVECVPYAVCTSPEEAKKIAEGLSGVLSWFPSEPHDPSFEGCFRADVPERTTFSTNYMDADISITTWNIWDCALNHKLPVGWTATHYSN